MKINQIDLSECTIASLVESGIIEQSDVLKAQLMSIKKKVAKYHQYTVFQGKGKDTRWFSYITDPETQKRKKVAAPTEEELFEKLYLYYYGNVDVNTHRKAMTLRVVYPDWIKYRISLATRMNTIRRIETDYKRYYLEDSDSQLILDTPLDELSLIDIETWAMGMIKKYEMTYKQYNAMALILRQVMDYLVKQEKMQDNRFRKVKLPQKCFKRATCKNKEIDSQIFCRDELISIIDYATAQADAQLDESFLAIPLIVCTGLRISECLGLEFSDFDEEDNTVSVTKSFAVVDEKLPNGNWAPRRYEVMDYLKQNADPRTVLVNDECFEIIRHIRKILFKKGLIRNLLFVTDTPNNVEMKLYRICDELGIKRRSPHKLRKTYVSTLLNNGFDLDFVRAQVGHQDPRTTLNSYTFTTTRNKDKIAKLNEVI